MELHMDGRNALITGGSTGLGKAMAERFLSCGASVAIVARRAEVLGEAKSDLVATHPNANVQTYVCDVTDPKAIEAMFAQAEHDLGQIDVLVNNAGKSETGAFADITDEVWQSDLELKLFAAIRLCRLALPGMKARRWGRVINVLNTAAKAPRAGSAPTSVSRAAGMALTKVLAAEGAEHNVLVNCMLTGIIESDQWVRGHQASSANVGYREYLGQMAERMSLPMGRVGESVEFANMACFLASDAGSYITGTAINVDGGLCPVV
ncbi:MAG: SDR family oxidoreductase [Pseudomonadota bacterium]